ncbi:T6SS immunity protein Tli4 family protein [Chromobacterium amazonense]|uniref:T6SS immunity protein Tli4 family protein n=1 Tax=Chromobacterium amazonense TaxID=1382803 RepID=UPI0011B1E2A9|nr:T6SS immunity protein Tli4 family protein [Chromobacterium amazonense]
MQGMKKWKWLAFGGIAFAIIATAYYVYADPLRNRTYTMKSTPKKIESLFLETKPVCFGRYLINVPKGAQVIWGPTDIDYQIVSYPGQGGKMPIEIQDKIREIKGERHRTEQSMLIGIFDGPNPESKVIVSYESVDDTYGANLYSYIRLGKNGYIQSVKGMTLGLNDDSAPMGLRLDKNLYKKNVAILQDIAHRLRVRADDEIPSESGICIEAGFLPGQTAKYQERVSIGFRFPEYPDVSFSLSSFKTEHYDESNTLDWALTQGKEQSLLQGKGLLWDKIDTLQKGPRVIAGWEGDEILSRLPEDGSTPSHHQFRFNYAGKPTFDPLHPVTEITMNTGVSGNTVGEVHPSLTDDEAVALWNKLTSTIRVRPVVGTQ